MYHVGSGVLLKKEKIEHVEALEKKVVEGKSINEDVKNTSVS